MKTLSPFKSQTLPQRESAVIQEDDIAETSSYQEPLTKQPKILIIIPAYNEEKNIGSVLEGIQKQSPGFPILVINDGSSDNTEKIALEHNAEVISLPYNSGYGVALQTGFLYAIKNILKKIRGKPKDSLICGPSDLDNACIYEIVEIIKIKAKSIFD